MAEGARSRLLVAVAASAALHVSLILGVEVRPPAPPLSHAISARLQSAQGRRTHDVPRLPFERVRLLRQSPAPALEPRPLPVSAREVESPAFLAAPPGESTLPSVEMPLLADSTWYPAKQLDVYPRAVTPVHPTYPEQAAMDGVRGEVTVLLLVDEHGRVQDASIVEASPEGVFEETAVAAFRSAQFEAAQRDGRRVRSRIVVRVVFAPDPLESARGESEADRSP